MSITRRGLLVGGAALGLSACSGNLKIVQPAFPQQRVENILASSNRLLTHEEILQMIPQYGDSDNTLGIENGNAGNYQRFYHMVASRIENGNIEQISEIIREIARHEIDSAYANNRLDGFSPYDTTLLDNPHIFFGDIGENPQIAKIGNTLYDTRIMGEIDLHSPEKLLAYGNFPQGQKNVGFVIKDQNGLFIFAYYQNGILKYVAPCSPGRNFETAENGSGISYDETPREGLSFSEYKNLSHYFPDDSGEGGGPMPYAHQFLLHGNKSRYYTHIGSKITGEKLSHGCIRLPAWLAYILFYDGDPGANIYVMDEFQLDSE